MTRRAFRLYAVPSFWEGIARLIDVGGMLNEYNYSKSEWEADYRALQSDWGLVGEDLWGALDQFIQEHQRQINEETRAKTQR
jgi:hypothetical protein